jgi:hypothetical protein
MVLPSVLLIMQNIAQEIAHYTHKKKDEKDSLLFKVDFEKA